MNIYLLPYSESAVPLEPEDLASDQPGIALSGTNSQWNVFAWTTAKTWAIGDARSR